MSNPYLDLVPDSPEEMQREEMERDRGREGGGGGKREGQEQREGLDDYLDPVPRDEENHTQSEGSPHGSKEYIPMKTRNGRQSDRKRKPERVYYNVSSPLAGDDEESTLSRRDTVTRLPVARSRRRGTHAYLGWDGKHQYRVTEVPPWYLLIFLAFQHYLIMFGATVSNPLYISKELCIAPNDHRTETTLIGTIFVTSGISTLLQSTIGVRLPVVQGGSFTFVTPIQALMRLPEWQCPVSAINATAVVQGNITVPLPVSSANQSGGEYPFLARMREIQGALMVASLFQVLIGFSGIMGLALRFIGPLSISPTISLAGLALFDVAARYSSKQWWITLVTVVLIAAFSQYTRNLDIPCFTPSRGKGCKRTPMPVFRLFPVILAISITWIICAILMATGVFPRDAGATGLGADANLQLDVLAHTPWYYFPYPGQWGTPTVSVAGVFGILAGVLAGIVESVGDYYACARMSGAPPPPMHAVNRGIGVEGLCCLITGSFGTGSGTTTYSENIGVIGITKVGSRRVIQVASIFMIVFGIFGKFGTFFLTIPDPIVGGVFIVMFGMVAAVGISNLQFVNLNSSRNLFIIGFSFFFGLTLPKYLNERPNAIQTGSPVVDQILTVLLSTSMFVGGLTGFVLDNTIPGTDEERGLIKWREQQVDSPIRDLRRELSPQSDRKEEIIDCYEIPRLTKLLQKWSWTKYIPFLPTFQGDCLALIWKKEETFHPDAESTSVPGSPV